MSLFKKVASVALGLAVSATMASAQVTVDYSTVGNFTGGCLGTSCTIGGMTLTYTPLTNNTIGLDGNNGYFSFLSYGFFTVTGAAATQQSFAGVGFSLSVTQNLPAAGGTQVIAGNFLGGIDATSSSLRWDALPQTWNLPYGAGTVNYSITTPIPMQPPTSNLGVTTVQGSVSTRPQTTVPEPSTYALMAAGLAGVFGFARRRRAV